MDTKTYIFIYFYEQYLVLFTIVLRNNRCDERRIIILYDRHSFQFVFFLARTFRTISGQFGYSSAQGQGSRFGLGFMTAFIFKIPSNDTGTTRLAHNFSRTSHGSRSGPGAGSGGIEISRVGSGRVGSGRVGSGRVGSGCVGSGQVALTRSDPREGIRPVKNPAYFH